MFQHVVDALTGNNKKIKGTVVLMKKNVLDLNDFNSSLLDGFHELLGKKVSLQLISAVNVDQGTLKGKLGKPTYLENWITTNTFLAAGESAAEITFDWDEDLGIPGAFTIRNNHPTEFYLKTLTLDVPGQDQVHFVCNSWVYPAEKYKKDRVFFSNQTYLPSETPEALRQYREEELVNLRGSGTGELKAWERVYDYAIYNDLGDPDRGTEYARQILGGSTEFPYPRRGRTSRPPAKTDPKVESRLPLVTSLDIYVPRDERFGHLKMSDFLGFGLKSVAQVLYPGLKGFF